MAQNNKYLTYTGLETLVQKVASVITGTVSASGITLYLHGKTKDSSKNVINGPAISNVIIPIAGAKQADNSTAASGLITATDLAKLGGIAENAEVNQKAYSNVTVTNATTNASTGATGAVTVSAATTTDTLTITAGDNIKITVSNSAEEGKDNLTISNTYKFTHTEVEPFDSSLSNQTPAFGSTANIINRLKTTAEGHVEKAGTGTIKIPALPNVTVKAGTNTGADSAGDTTVKVVNALANGSTSSSTKIYVDYTTVEVPTKKYVDGLITTSEAVVLKGTIADDLLKSTGNLSKGDTYICTAAIETEAKLGKLEKGDVVIYNSTAKTYGNSTSSDWIVIQANASVYNGSAGFVPTKKNTTASASYFLNETGNWSIPTKRGIQVGTNDNPTTVYDTDDDGTIRFVPGTNLTITAGAEDNGVTPITFGVNMENVAAKSHNHTITANGTGDTWIDVSKSNGTNAVTYNITHKGPGGQHGTYTANSGSSLTADTSYVVTGVKYDEKGHIVGVTGGKLPADSKGVTSITPGTGLTRTSGTSEVDTAITDSGTINLKPAADNEIGGIKITAKKNVTVDDVNRFGVKINNSNVAYVEILEISTDEINGLFS